LFCICTAIYTGNKLADDFYCIFAAKICNSKKKKMMEKDRKQTRRKALIRAAKTSYTAGTLCAMPQNG
jgi:hypothetical protein